MSWTKEEDQILLDNYKDKTMKELQVLLNKTDGAIRGRKTALGLKRFDNSFTDEERYIITEYYQNHINAIDLNELSQMINRPKTSISRYARSVGLTNKSRPLTKECIEKIQNTKREREERGEYRELRQRESELAKKMIAERGHPRGMLGKHHTEETRKMLSEIVKERHSKMTKEEWGKRSEKSRQTRIKNGTHFQTTENAYSRCYGYKRQDLNQYFRSAWEANMARIYNYNNIKWEYESKRFLFQNPICGVESYQPDFYLPELDKWVEVKGWMDDKSVIRLVLFKLEYPDEYDKLEIIGEKEYMKLYKQYKTIDNFELEQKDKK